MKAKEKILREAARLFSAKGYEGASADEIIAAGGTSKGLLFYHYGNKEGLLTAVVDRSWAMILESCTVEDAEKSPGLILRKLIRKMTASLKKDHDYWKVYALVSLNKSLAETLTVPVHELSEAYHSTVEELFSIMGKKNPGRWAFFFDIQFRGIYSAYLTDPLNFPMENVRQVMTEMFTR